MPVRLWHRLYYITSACNVRSIVKLGILSRAGVERLGLQCHDISDQEVQRWRERVEPISGRSLHEYANLYLNPRNPMLSARRSLRDQLVILEVSANVLDHHEHLFTDGNAASKDTVFSRERKVVESSEEALRAVFWDDCEDGKRRRCAEVLVYPRVEPSFLVGALCASTQLVPVLQTECPFPVTLDPATFF